MHPERCTGDYRGVNTIVQSLILALCTNVLEPPGATALSHTDTNTSTSTDANPQTDTTTETHTKSEPGSNTNTATNTNTNADTTAKIVAAPPTPATGLQMERWRRRQDRLDSGARGVELFGAGLGVIAYAYLYSAIWGAGVVDSTVAGTREHALGRAALVPVVGSTIALHFADTATERLLLGTLSVVQLGGAVLTVVGAVRWARQNRARRLSLGAAPSAGGGAFTISGRF